MIVLERLTAPTADARALIEELDADLRGPYDPDQRHGFSIDRVFATGLLFFEARLRNSVTVHLTRHRHIAQRCEARPQFVHCHRISVRERRRRDRGHDCRDCPETPAPPHRR